MHEQMSALTITETDELVAGLAKLFALQDRQLSKDKSTALVDELSKTDIPFPALMQGLRSLMHEDLASIKISTITAASRKFIERTEARTENCPHCDGRGVVLMKDSDGYEFTFACLCPNAYKWNAHGLAVWGGGESQAHRGKIFMKRFDQPEPAR